MNISLNVLSFSFLELSIKNPLIFTFSILALQSFLSLLIQTVSDNCKKFYGPKIYFQTSSKSSTNSLPEDPSERFTSIGGFLFSPTLISLTSSLIANLWASDSVGLTGLTNSLHHSFHIVCQISHYST